MFHNDFELDWQFFYGDISAEQLCEVIPLNWQIVDLPHDYTRNQHFRNDPLLDHSGYLPGGVGCYRKEFVLKNCSDCLTTVEFDGICGECEIYCNGRNVADHQFFYSGFSVDLTGIVHDGTNTLAVRVDLPMPSGRWYTGAGINRHCRIVQKPFCALKRHGIHVFSQLELGKQAEIKINLEFEKSPDSTGTLAIVRPDGSLLEQREIKVFSKTFSADFTEERPMLWNIDTPLLYIVRLEISGQSYEERFGLRTIEFTRDRGMFLNGKSIPVQGVAIHEGFGALGTAFCEEALERMFKLMREIGANAIRTVHNPPPPELIKRCDELGIMVMLEYFDCWETGKVEHDFHKYFKEQWFDIVKETSLAFRNHPSIILWSIGNEVVEQMSPECGIIAKQLSDAVRKFVPGGLITCGCDEPEHVIKNNIAPALDVLGMNYRLPSYETAAQVLPLCGSENIAALASRGAYQFDNQGNIIGEQSDHEESSYSITKMYNGCFQEEDLLFHKNSPYSPGEFAWCLYDYLGEALHRTKHMKNRSNGNVIHYPARSSYWGFFDTCGFPKDRVWLFRSLWRKEPIAHLMPHWTWHGREGKPIPVWVYGNFDSCELFLNGKSLGKRSFDPGKLHAEFMVNYEPGKLELKGYDKDGNVICSDQVQTAGDLDRLELLPEEPFITPDGIAFVKVQAVDKDNIILPDANNCFEVTVSGGGILFAADNGDSCCHEKFDDPYHSLYHGMALLMIRQNRRSKEPVKISLRIPLHDPYEITLPIKEKLS
ncbi:MAG: DUF4982 domain-containing protein [Lentisphaeria bacterium]|nr:DUF4982 domain-containing protein [Lentisphaeria bacterium]